tara:strand:- start:58 stop:219 length:162 start_codon:yes stop_codon:yes gene_type:complete
MFKSPAETALLKARIKGNPERIKRIEEKIIRCQYCGMRWFKGGRQYHRENCTL